MTTYQVVAPLVILEPQPGVGARYLYEDAVITDLSVEEAARLVERGLIVEVDAPAAPTPAAAPAADTPDAPAPTAEPSTDTPAAQPPPQNASKENWVSFAVSRGADPDEAEAMTKAALIETFGS